MIRIFDVLFSFIGIVLLLPLFLIVAIILKIDSEGNIFYVQQRVGIRSKEFNLIKFRTMHNNSDKKGLLTVGENDNRITRVGYYLRKYKIDELPQLFNVLIGDMSIVGPRPEVKKYVEFYTEEQKKVLGVKPGITDYASIRFVNENHLLSLSMDPENTYINEIIPKKIMLNMIFINNPSIYQYFRIIIKTIIKLIV